MKKFYLLCFHLALSIVIQAQSDTLVVKKSNSLNVYFDCNSCDFTYFREEFTAINYVRDRHVADVQIIVTEMNTGGGGTEFSFQFIGQGKYAHLVDTLKANTKADATKDETRKLMLTTVKNGLFPFFMKTEIANQMTVNYPDNSNERKVEDPWNSWVFDLNVYAYMNGQQSYKSYFLNNSISASRITKDIKHYSSVNYNLSSDKYRLYDTNDSLIYSVDTYSNSFNMSHSTVWSIGNHWGTGIEGGIYSSTYSNLRVGFDIMPAIEYNLYSYEQASQKQLRFAYYLGFSQMNYLDTTVYDKMSDDLFYHKFVLNYKLITKWGSINASGSYKSYLHDFSLYNVSTSLSTDIRIFKGLSLSLYSWFSLPHNQVSLVKTTTTPEEVLLKQHELKTQFSYYFSFGLSYTFGSIYNNVVNPRLN